MQGGTRGALPCASSVSLPLLAVRIAPVLAGPLCSAGPCPSEEGGLFSWHRDLQVGVEPWSLQVFGMRQA